MTRRAPEKQIRRKKARPKTPGGSETLLAEAQALSHMGSWAWDVAADVVTWSDELFRIMGMQPQERPINYQVFLDCVHPEDRERIHRVVQQALSDRRPFSFEYRVILHGNAIRIQHGKGAVITDDRGRATRMHGTTQDVTEQKQAAEDLRRSEERFTAFMDNLPGFAWMKDGEGRYLYLNKAMQEIPNIPANWSGKTDADFWPPAVAAQYRANDQKVMTSRAPFQTVEYYPSDKGDRYVLVSKFPIFDSAGAVRIVAGASADVTEQLRAKEALEQLAAIVESSNDAIVGINCEGNITSWNAAAERIYGYSAPEILGRPVALLGPPEIADLTPTIMPRLKQGERIDDLETIRLRKDGSRVHVSVSLSPIKSPSGEITGISAISRDITERKAIEKALETAEEKYRSIFNNAVDGIFRTSPEGKFLVANRAAARIYGFASPEELIKERWDIGPQGYVDPGRREEFKRLIQEQGVVSGFEHEAYRKDGSRVWISENTRAIRSPGGETIYFEGVFEDITDRKRAEENVWQSHNLLRAVTEGTIDAMYAKDTEGRYLLINTVGAGFVGKTPEEVIGLNDTDLFSGQTLARIIERDRTIMQTGEMRTDEDVFTTPAGPGRIFLTTKGALRDSAGAIIGLFGVSRDITQSKREEEKLRETETRFRQLAENIDEVFWISNREGLETIYISPAYERIWGRSCESLYNKPKSWMAAIHPDDREWMEATLASEMGRASDDTYRIVRSDGSVRWIRDRGFPVHDESGRLVRFAGIAQDITQSKQAEDELQKANEQLHILSRRLFQVQENEKRHMARELHDEMGQALTVAKINLQSAQRVNDPADLARRLAESIGILDGLLQQTRQLSLDLRPPLLDDLGLVPALRSLLDEQAQRAGFRATFFADPALQRLSAEIETACFRVAQQALTNTVRHAQARNVNLELHLAPHALHLIVRDDGIGFDVEAAEERARRGASLGLPGMRERISLLGGELDCKSSPGRGSEVHAFLPLATDSTLGG